MKKPRIEIPQQAIAGFCQRWKVTEFALFGSVMRDDFGPDSDIDVMVTFGLEGDWDLLDIADMKLELESLFGRRVDLMQRGPIGNPFKRRHVLNDLTVIYAA
jgi:predicted nucleotidyltransferase